MAHETKVYFLCIPEMGGCCTEPVEKTLREKGKGKIFSVTANSNTKYVRIEVAADTNDESLTQWITDLEGIGRSVDPKQPKWIPAPRLSRKRSDPNENKRKQRGYLSKSIPTILLGVVILLLPLIGITLHMVSIWIIAALSVILVFYSGWDIFRTAIKGFPKAWTMDTLFTVSAIVALTASILCLFMPWLALPMMLEAALLILGIRNFGLYLKSKAEIVINEGLTFRQQIDDFVDLVTLEDDTKQRVIKPFLVDNIQKDMVIRVKAGQNIPVDGICISANASVIQTILTGQDDVCAITNGFKVCAGMIATSEFDIQVTQPESDSHLAKKDNAVDTAMNNQLPIKDFTAKVLQYFVPAVFILAIVAGCFIAYFLTPLLAIQTAIAILVSACPCTLGFIVALACQIGLIKAAQQNITINKVSEKNDNDALEMATHIKMAVCDLNGTLTQGKPRVHKVQFLDLSNAKLNEAALLEYIYHLEKDVDHPIAKAICRHINPENRAPAELKGDDIKKIDREPIGVLAQLKNDASLIIGNRQMLNKHGIPIPKLPGDQTQSPHLIYVVMNKQIIAWISIVDDLRPDAKSMIDALLKRKIEVKICTGADLLTAQFYAAQLGIPDTDISAEHRAIVPTEPSAGDVKAPDVKALDVKAEPVITKQAYIKSLQDQGLCVAMIGDAGNDTEAIAQSNLGIAITSPTGHQMSESKAKVIIQRDSLWPIVQFFIIAQQTISNIKRSLYISFGFNVGIMAVMGGMLFLASITLNPGIGVALMVAQMLFVLYLAHRLKQEPVPVCPSQHTTEVVSQPTKVMGDMRDHLTTGMTPVLPLTCAAVPIPTLASPMTNGSPLTANSSLPGETAKLIL